ncbi:MAG: DNA topoisomerase IV subunit A [Parcubacteria group bacterium Gr01-1014_70]|nr:MAG: DNA topoisomerase IV subunit A [Parcubacteria group bacterium Gr01-1014_70]
MHIHKFMKLAKKATSIFVSLTTAIWLSGFGVLMPIAAHGQTVEDLQAQIQSLLALIANLQAQLSGLSGGSGGVQCTFTKDLTMGSTGMDVKCLQQYLNSAGHTVASSGAGSPGNETEYFGSRTQAAVSKWQAANGVSPTAGYFGSISRAKYNSLMASVPPPVTPPPVTPPPVTSTGTGITVGTAAQPAATLAVENSIHLPFTAFTLTASADGDVLVDSVTVERTGLAADAAFDGVVLLDSDMSPITAVAKTLNSTHQAVLSDDFTVPAGTTKTYYLAANFIADMASYAGQVATLSLIAVNTTAQVTGALPIVGTGHTINATLSIGSATLARGTNDPGNVGPTKEVGTKGYIFSALKATAGSAEDVWLKSIRWNQSGSAAKADLANVIVNADGTDYTPTVSSDGKYYKAVFAGDGLLIKKGEAKEVYVKADIASGSGRTIDFDLYRYDDMVFVGKTNGYKFKASATQTTADNDDDAEFQDADPRFDADQVEIGSGSLRVEKSNNVNATNIANGEDNVAIGAFLFDVDGEGVTFNSWVLTLATTDSDSGGEKAVLDNITIYDANGNAVGGPTDPKIAGSSHTVTITDSISVPVGENVYTIRGNLDNGWENNDTITVSFQPSTKITNAKGDTTGNTITPTPAAVVTANVQTVKAGTLTVSIDQSLGNQSYVEGGNGLTIGRYVLDATASGEDLKVTVVKIRAEISTGNLNNYQALQLFDGSTALNTGSNVNNPSGNSADTAATLSFTLDSPGLIVPKGTTKILSLKTNLTTGHAADDKAKFNFVSLINGDWGTAGNSTGADVTETYSSSTSAKITIKTGGGFSVVAAPSQPTEKWVTAGATGVSINVIRFTSTTEEFALTDLRLQIDTTGSSSASDISKVYLYDGDVLVQTKTPSFIDGVEDFTFPSSGTGSFKIPKDSFNELTVKVDIASIGTSLSGKAGQLVGVDYDGSTSSKNKALGKESGSSVHSSTATDVTGNGVVYFRSVPTLERVALPVTALTSGTHVLYKFKITADPAYDVAVHKFMFKVATTGTTGFGAALPSFTLWNTTDNRRVAAATGAAAAFFIEQGNYDNTGQVVVRVYADNTDLPSGQCTSTSICWDVIPAGLSRTYELRGAVTTDGAGDSVSSKLLGDDARSTRLVLTGSSAITMAKVTIVDYDKYSKTAVVGFINESANVASSSSFIWSDFSSDATTTHSINTGDWMNGFKVPGLLSSGLDASTMSN